MPFKSPLHLSGLLNERRSKGLFRALKQQYPAIDFSSNDYLGFSRNHLLINELNGFKNAGAGSTGSRLISGNSQFFDDTEAQVAAFHGAEAALLFNSGYDANVGLLSSVPQKNDLVLSDELIHASIYDGIRLSYARHYKFRHNDLEDLSDLLARHSGKFTNIYIAVESVYSMDGDFAPLREIVSLCHKHGAYLVVDEAHAIGVFGAQGRGLCRQLGIENNCFARVYTYGKAMGCHGAAIVGSSLLRDYLVNFARSFIYTTAMPGHSLQMIRAAYRLLQSTDAIAQLKENIAYFNEGIRADEAFIPSESAIHCRIITGNDRVQAAEEQLASADLFAKSIKSPTVKQGQERIRFCLHAFNTKAEIDLLLRTLKTINFN